MMTMTKHPEVDIILVGDNNRTTKNCISSIRDNVNIVVEPFDGYNKSLNEGAKKCKGEYIAFCNNDLIFKEGWLLPLIDALNNYDSVSPWCSLTHHQWWNKAKPNNIYTSYEVGKCIAGWFIMMKRKTWEEIGGFDERFSFWYADNSFAEQLKSNGLRHALVSKSVVDHLQSQTLKQQGGTRQKELTKDQEKVFKKHYGRGKR